jgi:hypothetical protein
MTRGIVGVFFILALLAFGTTRSVAQPIAALMHADNIGLKRNVAILLSCPSRCYQNYRACMKQGQSEIHKAYCSDTYNWCFSHCPK